MAGPHALASSARRRALVLTLTLLASYVYFYQGGGWNENTRFDLTRAIVERHTLEIDAYAQNTGDKSSAGGHTYADKAPGASLTAVPAVALVRAMMRAARIRTTAAPSIVWLSYAATVMAAAVPTALGACCLFFLALLTGAGEVGASLAVVAFGLGSPAWAYATVLFGHNLAGACLVAACLAAALVRSTPVERSRRQGLWVGLAAGWAVVTELQAAVPVIVIAALALWNARSGDRRRLGRTALGLALGAVVTAAVLAGYDWVAFGSPVHVGYASLEGYTLMRRGIFGVTSPKLDVAYQILFGSYRGLLPLAPVLVPAVLGLWYLLRRADTRGIALVAVVTIASYVCINAGYAYWTAGWTYGPRYLGPTLGLWSLGVAEIWRRGYRLVRTGILVLVATGVGLSVVAVSTTVQPPVDYKDPVRDLLWPAFENGQFGYNWQTVLNLREPGSFHDLREEHAPRAAWNLGEKAGLRGFASLMPLACLWLLAAVLWARERPTGWRRRRWLLPRGPSLAASAPRS
jgi:hypothetical protein